MALILYVEDHPPARLLMQGIIEEVTAHQLLTADSGQAAEALLQDHAVDLYILDLDLPDTNGIDLAKHLTALHMAPVILVSAYAEAVEDTAHFQYLAKPLDPDYVAEAIQRALG